MVVASFSSGTLFPSHPSNFGLDRTHMNLVVNLLALNSSYRSRSWGLTMSVSVAGSSRRLYSHY